MQALRPNPGRTNSALTQLYRDPRIRVQALPCVPPLFMKRHAASLADDHGLSQADAEMVADDDDVDSTPLRRGDIVQLLQDAAERQSKSLLADLQPLIDARIGAACEQQRVEFDKKVDVFKKDSDTSNALHRAHVDCCVREIGDATA